MSKNYYDIIKLPQSAAQAEVDKRLAEMAARDIPSHLQSSFLQIRHTLGDPQRRRNYDAALAAKQQPISVAPQAEKTDVAPNKNHRAEPRAKPISQANPYQAPTTNLQKITQEEAPPLFNPNAAGLWSLLFSPIFGSYLHLQNCLALGDEEGAKENRSIFYTMIALFSVIIFLNVFMPSIGDKIPNMIGLVFLLLWWLRVGKKHKLAVRERFGDDYPRRSMTKAVLIGIGIYVAVFIALFVLILIADAMGIIHLE